MSSLSLDSTVVASRDQVAADLADEVIILGMKEGAYYGVDGPGARIWALVQAPILLKAVVEVLLAEYDVPEDVCCSDVLAFAGELEERGLLTRVADGTP